MTAIKTKIGKGGRVVIPAEYRKKLGVNEGDEILLVMKDGEVRITTTQNVIKRAQKLMRQHNPEGKSLVDELIKDRRAEAARE